MAILTAPGVHPSLAMGLERKTVIMLSSGIATDHTLLYLDFRKIHQTKIDTHCHRYIAGKRQLIAEVTMSDRAADIFELWEKQELLLVIW